MSGVDFLADTNFIIYLLEGNKQAALFADNTFAISVVTEMELLGHYQISKDEADVIQNLVRHTTVLDFSQPIKERTIALKQHNKIKLPDAIIAATALYHNLPILSADKGFKNIEGLELFLLSI